MNSTSISVRGDRIFVRKMRLIAERKGLKLAEIVRNALNKEYGKELDELDLLDSFFETDGTSEYQMVNE